MNMKKSAPEIVSIALIQNKKFNNLDSDKNITFPNFTPLPDHPKKSHQKTCCRHFVCNYNVLYYEKLHFNVYK